MTQGQNGVAAQNQALADALATARVRLADERNAYALCLARGYQTDAAFAASEIKHYEALVARLEARLAK